MTSPIVHTLHIPISRAPHFNKGRFGVASLFPQFVPLWFLFVGIFEILCLCQPPEKPTRLEGQHQRRNCQYTGEGHYKHPKSIYVVYGQWGTSPIWYDFQNYVKQNFKYVLKLWNKIKTFLIYTSCFIAFWKKEVMLPHPVL